MQRTLVRRNVSCGGFGDLNEDSLGEKTQVTLCGGDGNGGGRPGSEQSVHSALQPYLKQPLEIWLLFRTVRTPAVTWKPITAGRSKLQEPAPSE